MEALSGAQGDCAELELASVEFAAPQSVLMRCSAPMEVFREHWHLVLSNLKVGSRADVYEVMQHNYVSV